MLLGGGQTVAVKIAIATHSQLVQGTFGRVMKTCSGAFSVRFDAMVDRGSGSGGGGGGALAFVVMDLCRLCDLGRVCCYDDPQRHLRFATAGSRHCRSSRHKWRERKNENKR